MGLLHQSLVLHLYVINVPRIYMYLVLLEDFMIKATQHFQHVDVDVHS